MEKRSSTQSGGPGPSVGEGDRTWSVAGVCVAEGEGEWGEAILTILRFSDLAGEGVRASVGSVFSESASVEGAFEVLTWVASRGDMREALAPARGSEWETSVMTSLPLAWADLGSASGVEIGVCPA